MEVNLNQIDSGKNNNKIMVTKDQGVKKANVFFLFPIFSSDPVGGGSQSSLKPMSPELCIK